MTVLHSTAIRRGNMLEEAPGETLTEEAPRIAAVPADLAAVGLGTPVPIKLVEGFRGLLQHRKFEETVFTPEDKAHIPDYYFRDAGGRWRDSRTGKWVSNPEDDPNLRFATIEDQLAHGVVIDDAAWRAYTAAKHRARFEHTKGILTANPLYPHLMPRIAPARHRGEALFYVSLGVVTVGGKLFSYHSVFPQGLFGLRMKPPEDRRIFPLDSYLQHDVTSRWPEAEAYKVSCEMKGIVSEGYTHFAAHPDGLAALPDAPHVHEILTKEVKAVHPSIRVNAVVPGWLVQHENLGCSYSEVMAREDTPLLYYRPYGYIFYSNMCWAVLLGTENDGYMSGIVFVGPDLRFICSSYCQLESQEARAQGIHQPMVGVVSRHTLQTWLASGGTDKFASHKNVSLGKQLGHARPIRIASVSRMSRERSQEWQKATLLFYDTIMQVLEDPTGYPHLEPDAEHPHVFQIGLVERATFVVRDLVEGSREQVTYGNLIAVGFRGGGLFVLVGDKANKPRFLYPETIVTKQHPRIIFAASEELLKCFRTLRNVGAEPLPAPLSIEDLGDGVKLS